MVQKEARIGMAAMIARKNHVNRPPPTLRARYNGTRARRVKRRTLEKFSLPAPSAGRGAFLIAGYFENCVSSTGLRMKARNASGSSIGTYSCGSDPIILHRWCGCGSGRGLDELEVIGCL